MDTNENGISGHRKQINTLLTEIYQTFSGGKSSFYEKHFHEKRCNTQSKNIKPLNPTQNKCKKVRSLLFQFSCLSLMESAT